MHLFSALCLLFWKKSANVDTRYLKYMFRQEATSTAAKRLHPSKTASNHSDPLMAWTDGSSPKQTILNMKRGAYLCRTFTFILLNHFCINRLSVLFKDKWHSVTPPPLVHYIKPRAHRAHLYDYTTPAPSADAFMWHVPGEPLMP